MDLTGHQELVRVNRMHCHFTVHLKGRRRGRGGYKSTLPCFMGSVERGPSGPSFQSQRQTVWLEEEPPTVTNHLKHDRLTS